MTPVVFFACIRRHSLAENRMDERAALVAAAVYNAAGAKIDGQPVTPDHILGKNRPSKAQIVQQLWEQLKPDGGHKGRGR